MEADCCCLNQFKCKETIDAAVYVVGECSID